MAVASVATVRGAGAAGKSGETVFYGGDKVTVTQVTMDATNYVAGGVPLTPAQLGLGAVLAAFCNVVTAVANGPTSCWYDKVNQKLKANGSTGEIGGVSLSGAIIEVTAYGY